MARQHRSDPDGGIHHVMNRGVDRADIFTDDADRRWFVRLLGEACVAAGVRVVAYCLVRNHFHLVLRCPNGGLSEAMWRLTAEYARVFNHRHERTDSLFGGRFKSKLVESDEYLVHLLRYVHRNPLDIGQRPDAWPWSSYPIYLGQGRAPEWMSVGDALVATGGSAAHRAHVEAQVTTARVRAPMK